MPSAQVTGFALAALQYGYANTIPKPERRLGDLKGYITLQEVHRDELEITEHPIEQGAMITDHAFKLPARLQLKISWSNSPNNGGLLGGIRGLLATGEIVVSNILGQGVGQIREIYQKLLAAQEAREPLEVFTGKRMYPNMLIKSLVVTTEPSTENVLEVDVELQQIIRVSTSILVVSRVPPEQQQDSRSTQATTNSGNKTLRPSTNVDEDAMRRFVNP